MIGLHSCCSVFRSHQNEEHPQEKQQDDGVQLTSVKVNEDGGRPLTDGEDHTFMVEIPEKYADEVKEPSKANVSASDESTPAGEEAVAVQCKTYEPSLWLAICRTYFKPFAVGAFFKLVHDILMFIGPLLLKYVVMDMITIAQYRV